MGISDYNAVDSENKTVPVNANPGSATIEIGKGIHSPQGHDIQRQAIQRVMADLKAFSIGVISVSPTTALTFLRRNAGNTAYEELTAAETRNALNTPPVAADRTALAAQDASEDATAILSEAGYQGTFDAVDNTGGTYDDLIAADTVGGEIKVTTGNPN